MNVPLKSTAPEEVDPLRDEFHKKAGKFLAGPEFDAAFAKLHPFSLPELIAGLFLGALLLRPQVIASSWARICSGDYRSARLRRRYARLGETGKTILTCAIVANRQLFETAGAIAPALVVGNFVEGNDNFTLLNEWRERMLPLALQRPGPPADPRLAALLPDLDYRFGRRRAIPSDLTGGREVILFDLMIVGDFLVSETLKIEAIPCLAEPGPRGLICPLPSHLLIQAGQERQRTSPAPPPLAAPLPKGSPEEAPNALTSAGFAVRSPDDVSRLIAMAVKSGTPHPLPGDRSYVCSAAPDGVELWMQCVRQDQVVGFCPHFAGGSQFTGGGVAILVERVVQGASSPLDGRVVGKLVGEGGEECPVVFDVPDYQRVAATVVAGARLEFQLAAFALQLEIWEEERSFLEEQERRLRLGPRGMSPECFIPSGRFNEGNQPVEPPEPRCIFSGRVLEAEERVNARSGLPFVVLVVKTQGGVFDLVADPRLVQSLPKPGHILFGQFRLTGRLSRPPPA